MSPQRIAGDVQRILAETLNGTTEVDPIPVPPEVTDHRLQSSSRIYDLHCQTPYVTKSYRELKFGRDPVVKEEVQKDLYLMRIMKIDVTYDFVPNLQGNRQFAQRDLDTLDYWGIPWRVWDPVKERRHRPCGACSTS